MKRTISLMIVLMLLLSLAACKAPDIDVQNGNVPEEPEDEVVFGQLVDTSNDTFNYMRLTEEEMAEIEVKSGSDFDTITMEALQGYWYCDEGYGYEVFLEVRGDIVTIRETVDGVTQEVWYGTGKAEILPPGESGWKNPGLDIRTEDDDSIAMLVLRRVGDGYFTTANSGVFYKIIEK